MSNPAYLWCKWLTRVVCGALAVAVATNSHGGVNTVTIFSPSNNRNVSFQVYTPPGYATDTTRKYPVIISLHGIGGTGSQRATNYGPTLDAKINAAEILPMIWIFPDGQTNSFYGDAFDGHKQVYSQIINEQLPYVDSHYRTIANRDHRAMEGFSMGGFGAAMYTAKRPELFSAVVEYGGALATWQNLVQSNNAVAVEMYNSVESNFTPYSLWDQTEANVNSIKTQVNYKMIVGDADPQYNSNTRFRDHLLGLGIDPHFQVLPGVAHVSTLYQNEGSGLRFLSEHFAVNFRRDGDYNQNGDTDAADYSIWKAAFGSSSQLAADGNVNGTIDSGDYVVWRNQSAVIGSGLGEISMTSGSAPPGVPEPATIALLVISMGLLLRQRRR